MKPVVLCGNELPWVPSCKHLGNTIVNTASADAGDIRSQDIKIKRASFINKNNELIQEFHFAHPKTINEVNLIKNSHFYDSVLWNLSSKWVEKLEKAWNVATRRMFDLPRETHRYLVEPVSEANHVQILMARRFLNFVKMIRSSKKIALRSLLKSIEHDTRSATGNNLRSILLQTDVQHVHNLKPTDINFKYKNIPGGEEFRVGFVKEIIEVKNNGLEVPGFDNDELDDILRHLCVS